MYLYYFNDKDNTFKILFYQFSPNGTSVPEKSSDELSNVSFNILTLKSL